MKQTGYVQSAGGAGYDKSDFPPVEFEYTQVDVTQNIQIADPESLANVPADVDGTRYQWVDLNGEGSPGILSEQANGWFYKRNVSAMAEPPDDTARFEPLQLVADRPSLASGGADGQRLMDLAGDGHLYLVQFGGAHGGLL